MEIFRDGVVPHLDVWPRKMEEYKRSVVEIFVASQFMQKSPVRLAPTVWRESLDAMIDNFMTTGASTSQFHHVHICHGLVLLPGAPGRDSVREKDQAKGYNVLSYFIRSHLFFFSFFFWIKIVTVCRVF